MRKQIADAINFMLDRERVNNPPHFIPQIKPKKSRAGIMIRPIREGKMACKSCKNWVSLTDYYVHVSKKTGRKSYHSDCDRCRKGKMIAKLRMITFEEYTEIMKQSNGECEICKERRDNLVIDHCHESERVRGVLCVRCNSALGMIRDNPQIALAIAGYLTKHQKIEAARDLASRDRLNVENVG